jgi:hypothetical protein
MAIDVYVSYRRVDGGEPPLLVRLLGQCHAAIKLRIDIDEVAAGGNFLALMKEIQQAERVLYLLSPSFFNSPHCIPSRRPG